MHDCEEDLRVFWRNAFRRVIRHILFLFVLFTILVYQGIVEEGIIVLDQLLAMSESSS